jgi:hypothetical protein
MCARPWRGGASVAGMWARRRGCWLPRLSLSPSFPPSLSFNLSVACPHQGRPPASLVKCK